MRRINRVGPLSAGTAGFDCDSGNEHRLNLRKWPLKNAKKYEAPQMGRPKPREDHEPTGRSL
jgi:hypothetical protein